MLSISTTALRDILVRHEHAAACMAAAHAQLKPARSGAAAQIGIVGPCSSRSGGLRAQIRPGAGRASLSRRGPAMSPRRSPRSTPSPRSWRAPGRAHRAGPGSASRLTMRRCSTKGVRGRSPSSPDRRLTGPWRLPSLSTKIPHTYQEPPAQRARARRARARRAGGRSGECNMAWTVDIQVCEPRGRRRREPCFATSLSWMPRLTPGGGRARRSTSRGVSAAASR